MDVDVELGGLPDLVARLDHAHDGILRLDQELVPALEREAGPMVVADSPRMRPRLWGAGDVWTLPAGGWVSPRVQLPDNLDKLTDHVQEILDGR